MTEDIDGDVVIDVDAEEASESERPSRSRGSDLVREGDVAADYLESLLDILDLDGDLDMDVEGERAVVAIVAAGSVTWSVTRARRSTPSRSSPGWPCSARWAYGAG